MPDRDSRTSTTSRALAPAKLNLYLDVVGRRDDGFHDLETLFVATDWGDEPRIAESPAPKGVDLVVDGPVELPASDDNLALRAARAFHDAAGLEGHLHVELTKHIPPGQGLGGGSSDAGAVLRLLDQCHPGAVPGDRLAAIALKLGSDVPFFLELGAAIGHGRGEVLESAGTHPILEVVLILPPIHCSTPVVFKNLAARIRTAPAGGIRAALDALRAGDPRALRNAHYNALAVPAISAYPTLARFTSDVERRLGRPPCLSGSGAALFDLPEPGETERVLSVLDGIPGERRVVHIGGTPA